MAETEVRELPVDCILADPQQPRKVFLDIEILAKDIEKHERLLPILVRPCAENLQVPDFQTTQDRQRLWP